MKNNPSLHWEEKKGKFSQKKESQEKTSEILQGSWQILKSNKKLLWLSIIPAFIIGIILLGTFISLLVYYFKQGEFIKNVLYYISLSLALILSFFIYFYFRAVLIYYVYKFLKNEKVNFKEAFEITRKNSHKIIKWTFIDSAFEISMSSLAAKETGYVAALPAMATRVTWRLLTIFVIPVLIIENLPVKNAVIRSVQLFTKVWPKATVFEFSVKLTFLIVALVGVFVIPILIVILLNPISFLVSNYIEIIIGIAYGIFLSIILISGIIITTLREIFIVVLYNYADCGIFPQNYFKEETIKRAFK